jgi:PLP dependent protein
MIGDNVKRVLDALAEAAVRAGRNPSEVTLVAVTKTRTPDEVREAVRAGVIHLGENRVQEAAEKVPLIGNVVWHLVGPLQSNKAGRAAELFSWIDSVHSEKIACILSERAIALGKTLDILVQVNISGEPTKSGIVPEETEALVSQGERMPGLTVRGLMTIGTFGAAPEAARKEFRRMRELFVRLRGNREAHPRFDTLSMGMSGDFVMAVEEGSTMVRIGTAIFGERG